MNRFGWIVALAVSTAAGSVVAQPDHAGRQLTAELSGADVVLEDGGDPNGSGAAAIAANPGNGRLCFEISVSGISLPATGAHIQRGPANVNGPVVLALVAPDETGTSSGCIDAERALVRDFVKNPAEYYLQIRTEEHPGGAIRGQLAP
jgi:hypothetical protein